MRKNAFGIYQKPKEKLLLSVNLLICQSDWFLLWENQFFERQFLFGEMVIPYRIHLFVFISCFSTQRFLLFLLFLRSQTWRKSRIRNAISWRKRRPICIIHCWILSVWNDEHCWTLPSIHAIYLLLVFVVGNAEWKQNSAQSKWLTIEILNWRPMWNIHYY